VRKNDEKPFQSAGITRARPTIDDDTLFQESFWRMASSFS
jgi:hypothetical protein